MKKIYLFVLATLVLSSIGCQKTVLDKQPLDKILETQVWEDPNLLEAYVTNLYSRIQLPYTYAPNPISGELNFAEAIASDEGLTPHTWAGIFPRLFGIISPDIPSYMDYWDYSIIRDANNFIESGNNINSAIISEEIKKQRIAEARFIRAYTYFELVKRYGGIPLITRVQQINETPEQLFVPRDSEKKIYDFIIAEMDTIIPNLSADVKSLRFTRWAALAMKARAAIFAGTIAKYGSVQLDGLLGIPSGEANRYFNLALTSARQLIPAADGGSETTGRFSLYSNDIKPGDLNSYAQNYYNIFITEGTSESIFEKRYVRADLGHSTNRFLNAFTPTIEMLNTFETVDGSNQVIDWTKRVDRQEELWEKKEPRFHGALMWDQQPWFPNDSLFTHNYVITPAGSQDANPSTVYFKSNGKPIRGAGNFQISTTPLYRKKFARPIVENDWGLSTSPAILFRLAEQYLIAAEAAFELNNLSDALSFVNRIRSRGGVPAYTSIDMEKIRRERRIELMFEGHRFWDLRRWRLADKPIASGGLNGRPNRVVVFYDLRTNKYGFDASQPAYPDRTTFRTSYNYMPIWRARINNNPKLVQNPGY